MNSSCSGPGVIAISALRAARTASMRGGRGIGTRAGFGPAWDKTPQNTLPTDPLAKDGQERECEGEPRSPALSCTFAAFAFTCLLLPLRGPVPVALPYLQVHNPGLVSALLSASGQLSVGTLDKSKSKSTMYTMVRREMGIVCVCVHGARCSVCVPPSAFPVLM